MKARAKYLADPATRNTPLSGDEVEALIVNQGKALRDGDNIVHFLLRVAATIRDHKVRMSGLATDVSRMHADRELRSQPVARAMETLAALTPEERAQVLDAGYLAEVSRVEKAREDMELSRLALQNEANRLRFALAAVLGDESVPAAARQRVADAIARIQAFQPPSA